MSRLHAFVLILAIALTASVGAIASAQERDETGRPIALPQTHEYQKVIHKFMASVTERDVTHGVKEIMSVKPASQDPEYLYRNHIYSQMHQPMVGTKRGYCAVNSAPATFTLAMIEQKDGVYRPPAWPEALISMTLWDYPGNPFFNNRALKLRTFMTSCVHMMMFHDFIERSEGTIPPKARPDWHGYNPVWFAMPYPGFKDALPPDVQKAYEAGLKMIGERILRMPVKGESCENNYNAIVGLIYIARAINDPEFDKRVEAYAKPFYTDRRFFNPAGYWVERGGIDTGFAGTANWFVAWTALMTDWPWVKEDLAKVYRLRGHLILPEPDGTLTGPSHFNSRLGSPVTLDQWRWDDLDRGSARDYAASLTTDEAAYAVRAVTPEQLASAPAARVAEFNFHLQENYRVDGMHYLTNEELLERKLMALKWEPRMWFSYDFPASVNPGYEHYPKGARAHREQLEKAASPLLKLPMQRGDNFVRAFEKDFVVARQAGYATILHTGPVGTQSPDDNMFQFAGPLGLGGGQVSAFWTPATGSVILGLRVGMSYNESFDKLENWRNWPNHSITGITSAGKIFTSARNARPEVAIDVKDKDSTVTAAGPLVAMVVRKDPNEKDPAKQRDQMHDAPLDGKLEYKRTFKTDGKGVGVETVITGDGKDTLAELHEAIPIYMGRAVGEKKPVPTEITLQTGGPAGAWKPAAETYTDGVTAVKLTRFDGAVVITFATPRRVKISPAEFQDRWLNPGAAARNILIDALDNADKPATINGTKTLAYRIEPGTK